METLVTVEKITDWLTEQVQHKQIIPPDLWIEAAMKLNVLLQGEQDKLFELEQEVAKIKNLSIESGESVAKAKSRVEATNEYKEARKQKAKIERAIELIRLSKVMSRMSSDLYHVQ